MEFEELSKEHQEFLISGLFDHIKCIASSIASDLARVPGTFAH